MSDVRAGTTGAQEGSGGITETVSEQATRAKESGRRELREQLDERTTQVGRQARSLAETRCDARVKSAAVAGERRGGCREDHVGCRGSAGAGRGLSRAGAGRGDAAGRGAVRPRPAVARDERGGSGGLRRVPGLQGIVGGAVRGIPQEVVDDAPQLQRGRERRTSLRRVRSCRHRAPARPPERPTERRGHVESPGERSP